MKKSILLSLIFASALFAETVSLPTVQDNGKTLYSALANRQSNRAFTDKALSKADLAGICWSATGVNRKDGKRTVPTAMGKNEITLYVVASDAAYRYIPESHALEKVAAGDFRKETGVQDFVGVAAVNLLYVLDYDKAAGNDDTKKLQFGAVSAGAMAQNVGLYASANGLGNVVRGSFDEKVLAKTLKLSGRQSVILVQSVGPVK